MDETFINQIARVDIREQEHIRISHDLTSFRALVSGRFRVDGEI